MRRVILKWTIRLGLPILIIFAIEFGIFYHILTRAWQPEKADLITVFAGAAHRVEKGYELANRCLADYFLISPRTDEQLKILHQEFKQQDCFHDFIEEHAQTTFQNALFVGRIILKEHMNSVILVTNTVHMPRSYLLLRLQLLGSKIQIYPVPIEKDIFPKSPFKWSVKQKKMVYNEMLEFWGSLIEKLIFHTTGRLPERGLKQSGPISTLRSILLFEV